MKNSLKFSIAFILSCLCVPSVSAQQDAQYTQYMYNPMTINPAYVGSRDVLSVVGLFRTQWVGLDGAPNTGTFSVHSPVGERVGLGLNIIRDEIFIAQETLFNANFSYSFNLNNSGKLALGISAGGQLLDIDFRRANTGEFNTGDPNAQPFVDNRFSPQVGIGGFYYTDKFYVGLSVPDLLETEHFDESQSTNSSTATERMNFYLMSGYTFDLSSDLLFKPAFLIKGVDGAPLQVDATANFLIKQKLTLGVAYRWSAALSALVGFQVSDQIMIGFGYDRETTELAQYNDGSYEIFLRYELFKRNDRMVTPRFF